MCFWRIQLSRSYLADGEQGCRLLVCFCLLCQLWYVFVFVSVLYRFIHKVQQSAVKSANVALGLVTDMSNSKESILIKGCRK